MTVCGVVLLIWDCISYEPRSEALALHRLALACLSSNSLSDCLRLLFSNKYVNSTFHNWGTRSCDGQRGKSSEEDHKTTLNQHQSLSGEILPHFDKYNLSVALKLKKSEIGLSP